jgi:hypothetical protein
MTAIAASRRAGLALAVLLAAALPAEAQPTQVKPGFNVFSAQQDIEIGQQSAVEAERQLPILRDDSIQDYAEDLLERIAPHAPGHKFPYRVKVVNASDINAFALPGGPLYLDRGLLQAARTEGELAGVVAHEIAHIALRHGTHNASKAYATQAGLGILGGILGRGQTRTTQSIINLVGGFGLNALFLKYSRDAETQADVVGAQMLARSGYDPMEMASFFEILERQRGGSGGAAQFFSSHPAPANRRARIQQEARLIGAPTGSRETGRFASIRSELGGMGPARSMEQIARGQGGRTTTGGRRTSGPVNVRVERPSTRFETFRHRQDFFEIDHPDNWRAYQAQDGFGVTIVPEGGVVDAGDGQESIVYGAIVNHYDPFEAGGTGRVTLDSATTDLVEQIRRGNSHLRTTSRARREVVDGMNGRSVALSGRSPVTGAEERVTVFTRELGDGHVIYALFIAPGQDYAAMGETFTRMIRSLRVNDQAAHRAAR